MLNLTILKTRSQENRPSLLANIEFSLKKTYQEITL